MLKSVSQNVTYVLTTKKKSDGVFDFAVAVVLESIVLVY